MNLFRRSPKSDTDVAREQEKQAIKQQKALEKEAKKQHKAVEKAEQKQVKRELKQLKKAQNEQTKQQKLQEAQVKKAQKLRLKQLEAEAKQQHVLAKKADALRKKQDKALKREERRQAKQWQREHRVEAKAQKKAVRAERKRRKKLVKQRKRAAARRHMRNEPLVEEAITVDPIAVDGTPVLPRSEAPAFKESGNCATCRVVFQRMSKRSRHHCRNCGESCCKKCLSKVKYAMPWYSIFKPQKICLVCESIVFNRGSPATVVASAAESQPVGQSTAASPHATTAPPASAPAAMHPSSAARPRPMSAPVSLDSRRPNTLRRGGSSKGKKSSIWNLPIRPMLKRKESVQQLRNRTLDFQLEKSHQLAKASYEVLIPRSVELAPQFA